MTRIERSDASCWWVRFDYVLDGKQQHSVYARTDDHTNDERFLAYLDQRHAEALDLGAAPIVRKGRAAT